MTASPRDPLDPRQLVAVTVRRERLLIEGGDVAGVGELTLGGL